ncbi:hypothetical protein IW261DRAFT_1461450 [Armillaria novae-zelandiae]|uniref:Uncharacterized protein n=1 Tax=Armillaria novae-zelandiae TaxID=153914 RepID=A0AA39TF77_9AGAR|nr:hypothetical protein IW261DRAFT_1461450 [Armillaria novae-zelandiae]
MRNTYTDRLGIYMGGKHNQTKRWQLRPYTLLFLLIFRLVLSPPFCCSPLRLSALIPTISPCTTGFVWWFSVLISRHCREMLVLLGRDDVCSRHLRLSSL